MGRIVATIDIENIAESGSSKSLDALVDTGASYITLPSAWKEQFGVFDTEEIIKLQTATQQVVKGTICGATVDMVRHRLLPVKYMDVKSLPDKALHRTSQ